MGKDIWGIRFDSDVVGIIKTYAAIHKQLDEQEDWLDKTGTLQGLIREYAELKKENQLLRSSQAAPTPQTPQTPIPKTKEDETKISCDYVERGTTTEVSQAQCRECSEGRYFPACPRTKPHPPMARSGKHFMGDTDLSGISELGEV